MALSDDRRILASSLPNLLAERNLKLTAAKVAAEVRSLAAKGYIINLIIVGLPLHMNGSMSETGKQVGLFIAELKTLLTIEVVSWDERLTTTQAERLLKDNGRSRKQRAAVVDSLTAQIILQTYLDRSS